VFVSDSQPGRIDANLETLENLRANLTEHGRSLAGVPHVLQHNKRDLHGVLSIEELDQLLNEHRVASFAAVATKGEGVFETFEAISRAVMTAFQATLPVNEPDLASGFEAIEGGLIEALRDAKSSGASDPPASSTETAASARQAGFTLAALWPESERHLVREAEAAIARGRYARAVELCDGLLTGVLTSAAEIFGHTASPSDPDAVPILLGLDGRQYQSFRALVDEARSGRVVEGRRALEAMTFTTQARILRSTL
jgi:hypothetical protein